MIKSPLTIARFTALAACLGLAPAPAARAAQPAAAGAVLDIGGRAITFEARPLLSGSITLPFEPGNALLLTEALQRLRAPDIGPFASAGGQVLQIITVSGPDRKLAFERARTIRAALVRLGTAEPRALAAAAAGAPEAAAPAAAERTESVTVRFERLTRASCKACSASTLGTAALDSGTVKLATLTLTAPSSQSAQAEPSARAADRRENADAPPFSDRPALAPREPAIAAAPPPPARPTSIALPKPPMKPPAASTLAVPEQAPPRLANAPTPRSMPREALADRRQRLAAQLRLADARALGGKPGPGCKARAIIIDDYLPSPKVWICSNQRNRAL